jgi:hypothetical protein
MLSLDEVRRRLRAGELSEDQALLFANAAVQEQPSAAWWVLRGRLIQLSESPGYELEDAEKCFHQASLLEPGNPVPHEELGHYYEIQLQPDRARFHYRAALERGAGPACAQALAEVEDD